MRKSNFKLFSWLVVAFAFSATASAADVNVANGKTIFTQGKGDAQACQTCHGERAQGNDDLGAPRLANIGFGYVLKELTDFSKDKRTPAGTGAVMPIFAKALSDQDRRDVAAYVNSLDTKPELSDLAALKTAGQAVGEAYKGAQIVRFGIKDMPGKPGVSACAACHEYNGRGADPVFPRIGQQKYVYLVNQLHNWRASDADVAAGAAARTNDPNGIMRKVAKNLSDEDIMNVAAFLSAAPPVRGGGDTEPNNASMLHK